MLTSPLKPLAPCLRCFTAATGVVSLEPDEPHVKGWLCRSTQLVYALRSRPPEATARIVASAASTEALSSWPLSINITSVAA